MGCGRAPVSYTHCYIFLNLDDARDKIEAWRLEYNSERPHSSLGYRSPEELVAAISNCQQWSAATSSGAAQCGDKRRDDLDLQTAYRRTNRLQQFIAADLAAE